MSATKLQGAGYEALVCVVPPGATLAKNSRIRPDQLGKVPGKPGAFGWHGYDFLREPGPSRKEATRWDQQGANIGLLAARFPGLDIDVDDARLATAINTLAKRGLGDAPVRLSRNPRRLRVYRTDEPFGRMAAVITTPQGASHLVEMLCDGRQYLVHGTHPSGASYRWEGEPLWKRPPDSLTEVDAEQVRAFFREVADQLGRRGYDVELIGTGDARKDEPATPQGDLLAPDYETLQALVGRLPNDRKDRDHYRDVGYAIRAAGGEEALPIFLEWVERWTEGSAGPETAAADWSRFHPPYRRGWPWLQELAASVSDYNPAVDEFEADPDAVPPAKAAAADVALTSQKLDLQESTDAWAAHHVARAVGSRVRYVPETGHWHVWTGSAWSADRVNGAAHLVWDELLRLSYQMSARAAAAPGDAERKAMKKVAAKLQSTSALRAVMELLQLTPGVAVPASAFDKNPWELNTPAGVVDLKTGHMTPPDPKAMHSKSTAVAPSVAPARRWLSFLDQTTGGDMELQRFLQKLCGYALTGLTVEQTLDFVWGPGGNGKTVFAEAVSGAMGDYAQVAAMESFQASSGDRHPTDLAGLLGARLVTAEETQAGRRWDEQRIKKLTGGGRLRARFMRQDFFEYTPQFKLLIIGNHAPEIAHVDDAMRRRIHIVPFTRKPEKVDHLLSEKLKEEWPQILAWMIEGTLLWQQEGLEPPEIVKARTEEFLRDEDLVEQWLEECCTLDPNGLTARADLFYSWERFCNRRREDPGVFKAFKRLLEPKKDAWELRDVTVGPVNRRVRGYRGILLKQDDLEDI